MSYQKGYHSPSDLPDWVKMVTGGLAGSVAEVLNLFYQSSLLFLLTLR